MVPPCEVREEEPLHIVEWLIGARVGIVLCRIFIRVAVVVVFGLDCLQVLRAR